MTKRSACMIAYANYFTDARIKNYVEALLKEGYQVDVYALGQHEPTRPGLRVFCLMPKIWSRKVWPYLFSQLWFFILATLRVSVAFVQNRYTIVHVHNMPDFIVFAALIPKLFGAKVILDVHDTMPEAYATKFDLPLSHPLIELLRFEERLSAAFADHVITTNDLHREVLVGHGIRSKKISIIMNVGNEKIFQPQKRRVSRNGLILSYHGTVAERLGLDLILDAIQQVRSSCPNLRFILIGDGDYMPKVRKLILEDNLESIVETKRWIPVEHLQHYLEKADVGVVGIRRYYEIRHNWGLPVKMLEYATMEIPTIAPRLRVIEHYFNDCNAILYEPDSPEDLARCIKEVYEHPERLENLKHGLRDFNARYNWASMEQKYLNLVSELTSSR